MNVSRATVAPLVIMVALLTSVAGCGAQPFEEAVGVLAKNTKYSKPQLEDAFRAANGGKALTDDAAKDLKGTQVADEVLDAVNDVADAACKAFDLGLKDIADTQLGSPLEHDQATGLLAKMKSDVAAGRATTESIDLACKAKDALAQF